MPTTGGDELRGLLHGEPRIIGSLSGVGSRRRVYVMATHLLTTGEGKAGELPADDVLRIVREQMQARLRDSELSERITDADLVVYVIAGTELDASGIRYKGGLLVYERGQATGRASEALVYMVMEQGPSVDDVVDHIVTTFVNELKAPHPAALPN